jgi:hypothetical protein
MLDGGLQMIAYWLGVGEARRKVLEFKGFLLHG